MKRRNKFYSLNRKFFHLGVGLSAVLVLFCFLFWGSNRYLFDQQNRLLQVQQAFSALTEGLSEADSYLYTYAQMKNEALKEEIQGILGEMAQASRELEQYIDEPIFTDLTYLTEAYCRSAEAVLLEKAGTRQLLTLYQESTEAGETIRFLMREYQEAVDTDRVAKQENLKRVQEWIKDSFFVAAAVLMGVFLLILRGFSKRITGDLGALTRRAEQICEGTWEIDMPREEKPKDEVGILSAAFYRMLEVIHSQIQELKRKEALERKLKETQVAAAQMKAKWDHARLVTLQSRVNPHFLFNALNVIGGQAAEERAEKTMDMIFQTADYLRYSLDKLDKTVTLEEELENARDYLGIQKGRFGKRLTYSVFCQEDLKQIKIPSMILQPLCENALIHGIMPRNEGGTVSVRVYSEEEKLHMAVEDNGLGISGEQKKQIEERLKARDYDDANGIGLYNVMQRLVEFFGREVECRISSIPLENTRVELTVPLSGKEDDHEKGNFGG